nr:basic proline-rich protein-like [Aegilops tauschii subsp. strangulata]
MRARLHSRLLLLALLPPCYCGSVEHPTMPALQLALGHPRVLVVPAARARSLPQPSQLQPLMHPSLLSLRAPAPVLARRPRARGLWLSLAAQPCHTVRLRCAAYLAPEAPISAQPTPLARRPPPTPARSSSRTGSRACRVVLTRRPLRPPAHPRVSVTPPSTTPSVSPGRPASTPVGLRVQRPAAPSVRRLRLLRRAASSHRVGHARACPTSSPAASGSPVPPRAQPGPVASCAPPPPAPRPAASAAPAPCPGEPASDSRPCCSSASSSEPRRLAARAGCATLGLPDRLPGHHARCRLRPASAPTAPGLARRRPAPCLPRACSSTRADRVGPVAGQGPAPAGTSAPPRTAPSRLPPHARAAPPPPAGVRAPLRLTAPCRLFPAVGRLPRIRPHQRCCARHPPRPQPAAVALGRPPLLATSGRGRVPRTGSRSPRPSPVPPAPAFGRASPALGLPRPAPGRRLAHSRPAPPCRSPPRGCRLPSYADSAFAPCARPGPAPAPPAGSRPRRRPRLAASSLGRPARARPLAGSPLPAGVRLRSRPSPRAGSAYSPPRASGSSPQTPPRPARHSTLARASAGYVRAVSGRLETKKEKSTVGC